MKIRLVIIKREKKNTLIMPTVAILSLLVGVAIAYVTLYLLTGLGLYSFASAFYDTIALTSILLDRYLVLVLLGCALAVAFKAKVWNIGAEGQYVMGMAGATYIVLFSPLVTHESGVPTLLADPNLSKALALVFGALLGLIWALIPGVLKAYLNVHEVPVTLLLNYIAYFIIDYLVRGPWRGRATWGYLRTDEIPEGARLTTIPGFEALRYELVISAVLIVAITIYLMRFTPLGLWIKFLGINPTALRFSGIDDKKVILASIAISGAIAGLTGALRLLGYTFRLPYAIEEGKTGYFGYIAILVAWLANNEPIYIVLTAYVVAVLQAFGSVLQIKGLVPPGVSAEALSLLFVGTTLAAYVILRIMGEYSIKIKVVR